MTDETGTGTETGKTGDSIRQRERMRVEQASRYENRYVRNPYTHEHEH